MPHVLPGMPNAAPNAPVAMPSQQAGQVQLGCMGCGQKGLGSYWERVPLWAKIAVPIGVITAVIVIAVAVTNRRRVLPYEAFAEEEIDY
jgi:hypothetical protein